LYKTALGRKVKVTTSIGIATFQTEARDIDGLFKIADWRFYQEKKGEYKT
jgi:predicted signal transduction protein with EAL and GGDEF domain